MRSPTAALVALALAGCGSSRPAMPPPGDPLDLVTAEQLYQIGLETEAAGDTIRAEQYFSAAIEQGYPEETVMPALLRVCVESSRLGDALDYAEPYIARHPEEWPLRVLVASIYMALDQPESALRHLEIVLDIAPEQPSGHYLMAVLARDALRDVALSREHFARYLELDPDGEHASEARIETRHATSPGATPVRLPSHDDEVEGAPVDGGTSDDPPADVAPDAPPT
jgi:tetratricopeptide (TPR) repeat protein